MKRNDSLKAHRLSISSLTDLLEDHPGKERPALSPDLFVQPEDVEEKEKEIEEIVDEESRQTPVTEKIEDKELEHSVLKPKYINNHPDSSEEDEVQEIVEEKKGESPVVTAKNLLFVRDSMEGAVKGAADDDSVTEGPYDKYTPDDKENERVEPSNTPAKKLSRWNAFLKHLGLKKSKNGKKDVKHKETMSKQH